MGLQIDRHEFTDRDYVAAYEKVRQNLQALKLLLARPGFGQGQTSLGAELEMCIVDANGQALPLNREILAQSLDPQLQLELDRFNLEYNLSPVVARGKPFSFMREELQSALNTLDRISAGMAGRIIAIGILPTLTNEQLQDGAMTDLPRYHALSAAIRKIRQQQFHIRIDGAEPLDMLCDSLTPEGANTSFQVHLRVNPQEFANHYNAAQLATPLALVAAANSPYFMGHDLWAETRIALFKQSVDTRGVEPILWRRAARVPFGHGWVRKGAFELFAESCALYPILIPASSDEDAVEVVRSGGLPELADLRLLQGTIWNWNRPVYDAADGGHLRIELRALPSGPTPIDMMANCAFLVGMTTGLAATVTELLPAFPFRYAEYNFYRAAQLGFEAPLLWPDLDGRSPRSVSARDLCLEMLPVAREGLASIGVDDDESSALLQIIRDRIESSTNPSSWQRRTMQRQNIPERSEALATLVITYLEQAKSGRPVTEWS